MKISEIDSLDRINDIVQIHKATFPDFFLTSLGDGFLKRLYKGFARHPSSGLLVAVDENNETLGFAAYSMDLSGFYRFLLTKSLVPFMWYATNAFIKRPYIILRLFRALTKPNESKRLESYVELSSIGVLPSAKNKGIGSALIDTLKIKVNFNQYKYIELETDAIGNDEVNNFYVKNQFNLYCTYKTAEGRYMNKYHYMRNSVH